MNDTIRSSKAGNASGAWWDMLTQSEHCWTGFEQPEMTWTDIENYVPEEKDPDVGLAWSEILENEYRWANLHEENPSWKEIDIWVAWKRKDDLTISVTAGKTYAVQIDAAMVPAKLNAKVQITYDKDMLEFGNADPHYDWGISVLPVPSDISIETLTLGQLLLTVRKNQTGKWSGCVALLVFRAKANGNTSLQLR